MSKRNIIAVEITDFHLKVFKSIISGGKRFLEDCEVERIHNISDEDLSKLLSRCLPVKKVRRQEIYLILPRHYVIVKRMRFPSDSLEEIRKMIGLQLVNKIPYPLAEIIYDFCPVYKDAEGYTHVFVVVVNKDICKRFLSVFHDAGLFLKKMSLSSFGILGWLLLQQSAKKPGNNEPVMIVNLDVVRTEVCFCQGENIYFSRSINYGSRDVREETLLTLVNQIDLSLSAYQKEEMGPPIKNILLVSMYPQLRQLKERIEKGVKIPVHLMSGLENIYCKKRLDLSRVNDVQSFSLVAGAGFIFSDKHKVINLIPKDFYHFRKKKNRQKKIFKFFLLVVLFTLLTGSRIYTEFEKRNRILGKFAAQNERLKVQAEKAKSNLVFSQTFEKQFSRQIFIPDLVAELYTVTPAGVSYRSISLDSSGALSLEGYADSRSEVNELQSNMVRSAYFNDVTLQFATKRKMFGQETINFKLISNVNKAEEQRKK